MIRPIIYILPDPKAPVFAPLLGWRWFLHTYLHLPIKQGRYVEVIDNSHVRCHPASVPAVRAWLAAIGRSFEVARPALQVVTNETIH